MKASEAQFCRFQHLRHRLLHITFMPDSYCVELMPLDARVFPGSKREVENINNVADHSYRTRRLRIVGVRIATSSSYVAGQFSLP